MKEIVGISTYRELVAKVFRNRLERYRLVYTIGRDRYLVPLSVFHRVMIWRGADLDSIVRSVKMFLESAPESTKPILELVVRRVSIKPEDLVKELSLSEESARAVLEQLSEHGLVIPARQRYLWIDVAPVRLIEEAMGRDVFIILYDVTKRYSNRLARYGIDLVEVLEDLVAGKKLDIASYVSSRRELIELDHYLFRLSLMGLVKFENG